MKEYKEYYNTEQRETRNILDVLGLDLNGSVILDPCCGSGHIALSIYDYIDSKNYYSKVIATDIQERKATVKIEAGPAYDFLSKDYPYTNGIDYIIMNPPYSSFKPFVIKSLEIAGKGVLVLARIAVLFDDFYQDHRPSNVYLSMESNGEIFTWLYYNKESESNNKTYLDWILI